MGTTLLSVTVSVYSDYKRCLFYFYKSFNSSSFFRLKPRKLLHFLDREMVLLDLRKLSDLRTQANYSKDLFYWSNCLDQLNRSYSLQHIPTDLPPGFRDSIRLHWRSCW